MRLFRRFIHKPGLPPGTLVAPEEKVARKPEISIFHYQESNYTEKIIDINDITESKSTPAVSWINVNGLGDIEILKRLGERFDIHELTLEDVLNLDQRPKFEEHDAYNFLVLKMLYFNKAKTDIESEQVSMVLTGNAALSFQERPGDVFDIIRERIRKGKGRVRKFGPDYLVYALMDAIVDNYFVVLETLGNSIENIETEVVENPTTQTSATIHSLRRKILLLRRSIWPLREVINGFMRSESAFINKESQLFLRDLYDHTIQVIETLETFREMLTGMLDVYLSASGNRMNEIMKVLTIISTLFIPLGFMAGLYGMNFKYMPELEWKWGYPVLLGVMAASVGAFLLYFRKRKWI
ncbi:MAG: magnesium/cobalt transporter CorA [Chitinivibrionales bacterium]|nr:magnesium/cobalt transporter CorA [Chitinivibrionales bacterium]